jgi:hypothetical protein
MAYAHVALFFPLFRSYTLPQVHGAIRRALLAKANTDMDRYALIQNNFSVLKLINVTVRVRIQATPIKLFLFRSTPGSTSLGAAYTSTLASTGQALEFLASSDRAAFVKTVYNVAQAVQDSVSDMQRSGSKRAAFVRPPLPPVLLQYVTRLSAATLSPFCSKQCISIGRDDLHLYLIFIQSHLTDDPLT